MPSSARGGVDAAIGERIRTLRDASGIERERMAQACGMSVDDYSSGEEGDLRFSAEQLFAIAKTLKVTMSDIVAVLSGYDASEPSS
jgi:transcriptional regulator with XRE-family HTH domain